MRAHPSATSPSLGGGLWRGGPLGMSDDGEGSPIAIAFRSLSVENDLRRTARRWAVEGISFETKATEKTVVYGLPESGKSTLMDAIRHAEKYPGQVSVLVEIQELFLKDSPTWTRKAYAEKYTPILQPTTYLVSDDACDMAVAYLARLDRGLLLFAGIDGYDCFHRFDRLLYLKDGRIEFDATPSAFFDWVKQTKPPELEGRLPDHLVESGGLMPGCPEHDE